MRHARRGTSPGPMLRAAAACGVLLLASCAPASLSASGQTRSDLLYVADRTAGTLSLLDGTGQRALGRAVPVGPAPSLLATGTGGRALVSSSDPEQQGRVSLLEPIKPAGWNVRNVALEQGARVRLIAGAGDVAGVVYAPAAQPQASTFAAAVTRMGRAEEGGPCELALIDLRRGAVVAHHPLCGPGDLPTGLALDRSAGGPLAYVALWSASSEDARGQRVPASARIIALRADTGTTITTTPLEGLPRPAVLGGALTLAPGPGGPHLYAVTAYPGTLWGRWSEAEYLVHFWTSGEWRLERFEVGTVEPEARFTLRHAPVWLGVAPDGAAAYALDGRGTTRAGSQLYEIDLASGASNPLLAVPVITSGGLAVTRDRVYVADPDTGTVWVVDRHLRRVERGVPFGRSPSAIVPLG